MATNSQRIADLEAEVGRLRVQVRDAMATHAAIDVVWSAGFQAGRASTDGFAAAAAASQPGPRHLRAVSGGTS
jgi:hypothetical protein